MLFASTTMSHLSDSQLARLRSHAFLSSSVGRAQGVGVTCALGIWIVRRRNWAQRLGDAPLQAVIRANYGAAPSMPGARWPSVGCFVAFGSTPQRRVVGLVGGGAILDVKQAGVRT